MTSERGDPADARAHPDAPIGKERKYALPERERRFLLDGPPPELPTGTMRIEDRYLSGTRLRLRRMTELLDGGGTGRSVAKLTQKIPAVGDGWGLITNLYLSAAEFDALAALPAETISKVRSDHGPYIVDVFEGDLAGLVLAEAEFDTDAAATTWTPPFAHVAEVTNDPRFTGGRLATIDRSTLVALLREVGIRIGADEA